MGTITGTALIDKVATLLYDNNNVRWSRAELLKYVNDGQRQLVAVLPEVTSTVAVAALTSGTRQSIPSGGWMLLDVTRNMGTDGVSPGRAVRRVDMTVLDESNPDWQADTATAEAKTFMYNARDRAAYYVHPPSDGTNYLEVVYSVYPTEQAEGDAILIDDVYAPALQDYILWRAYTKAADYADPMKAEQHLTSFQTVLSANGVSIAKLATEMGMRNIQPLQGQGSGG